MSKAIADPKVESVVKSILSRFISENRMFTAFDVTKQFRIEEPNLHVSHEVIKAYVHDQFEHEIDMTLEGYDRRLIGIGNPHPWLYYIPGKHDVLTYDRNWVGSAVKTAAAMNPKPLPHAPLNATKRVINATFGGIRSSK